MDQETFMEDCLQTHQDLLKLERRVHDWICGLAGIEVVGDAEGPLPWQKPEWNAPHGQHAPAAAPDAVAKATGVAPDAVEVPAETGLGEPLEFERWQPVDEPPAWEAQEEPQRMTRRPPRPARDEAAEPKRVTSDNPWAE